MSSVKAKRLSKSAQRQQSLGVSTRVLRLRIKDKHAALLRAQATEVNLVWNYSQDLALQVLRREHRFLSAFDIAAYTKGANKEGLSLHSQTVQAVLEQYCVRRKQFKRAKLHWRVSRGSASIRAPSVYCVAELGRGCGPGAQGPAGALQWR